MVTRVLIVDDHGILRAGLRALLAEEPELTVVGEAGDGAHALRLARAVRPDVVLMDIGLPDMDGLEVTRALLKVQPGVRVLILTMYEDGALLHAAIEAGAAGYIIKRAVEDELVSAIRAVLRGDLYVHPALTRALLTSEVEQSPARDTGPLTPREAEVLSLLAAGHTNREIAEQLVLSVRTVESHRANLMGKLDLHSRAELVQYAASHDLLAPDETSPARH
ncbi:MAG: response regulator [Anaerolineae bacterium]